MKHLLIVLLFAWYASGAQQDAGKILERSNEKIKLLRSISLNVTRTNRYTGQMSADVIISREKLFPVFGMAKVKMNGIVIGDQGSLRVSMSFDGTSFTYLNAEKNELVSIDGPTYQKIGRTGMLLYADAIPSVYYEDYALDTLLLRAVKVDMRNDTVIFNQPAYAVEVEQKIYNKFTGEYNLSTITIYIHKDSYLPVGRVNSPGSSAYYKIRSVNDVYSSEDFVLAGNKTSKQENEPAKEVVYLDLYTPAPDWTLPSSKAGAVTLSKLRGKVVMLDFWGTWCAPCLKSMPAVQSIYDHFKNKEVEVIGVSCEMENSIDVPAYIKKKGYTYPIVLDGKNITKDYKVVQFPAIYIIDKKGKIIFAGQGDDLENKKEGIIRLIEKALTN